LVLCEEEEQALRVMQVIQCSGLSAAPAILFSDNDSESQAFVKEDSTSFSKLLSPQVLRTLSNVQVTWLSCGFEHCLALTSDGVVASWGCGASGCLGHNDYLSYTEPKMIEPEVLRDVSYIECGGYHSAALTKAGKLLMWGRSDVGQLGLPKDKVTMDEHGYVMKQP
jgi:alpha-tubulin suppressor-like RCC1 family protein